MWQNKDLYLDLLEDGVFYYTVSILQNLGNIS